MDLGIHFFVPQKDKYSQASLTVREEKCLQRMTFYQNIMHG